MNPRRLHSAISLSMSVAIVVSLRLRPQSWGFPRASYGRGGRTDQIRSRPAVSRRRATPTGSPPARRQAAVLPPPPRRLEHRLRFLTCRLAARLAAHHARQFVDPFRLAIQRGDGGRGPSTARPLADRPLVPGEA